MLPAMSQPHSIIDSVEDTWLNRVICPSDSLGPH